MNVPKKPYINKTKLIKLKNKLGIIIYLRKLILFVLTKTNFNKLFTTLSNWSLFKYLKKWVKGSVIEFKKIKLIINEPKKINNLTFFNKTLSKTPKVPKATNKICNSIIFGWLFGCFKISIKRSLYVII